MYEEKEQVLLLRNRHMICYMSLSEITTIFIYTTLPFCVSLDFFFLNKQKSSFFLLFYLHSKHRNIIIL